MDRRRLELLHQIMELDFVRMDLNLFLDTHPENRQALRDYNRTLDQLKVLTRAYEDQFGPLTPYYEKGCSEDRSWAWIDEPWPWEIEYK